MLTNNTFYHLYFSISDYFFIEFVVQSNIHKKNDLQKRFSSKSRLVMQASHKMSFGLMHIHQEQMFRDVTLSFHLSDYQLQQLYTLPNQISFLRYQKVFCTKSYKNVQNKILVLMKDYVRFSHFARKKILFFSLLNF